MPRTPQHLMLVVRGLLDPNRGVAAMALECLVKLFSADECRDAYMTLTEADRALAAHAAGALEQEQSCAFAARVLPSEPSSALQRMLLNSLDADAAASLAIDFHERLRLLAPEARIRLGEILSLGEVGAAISVRWIVEGVQMSGGTQLQPMAVEALKVASARGEDIERELLRLGSDRELGESASALLVVWRAGQR